MSRSLFTIFLAFAACGAVSGRIYEPDGWRNWLAFPLPFAVLAAALMVRRRIPLFLLGTVLSWNAAFQATTRITGIVPEPAAFVVGGAIGGIGLFLTLAATQHLGNPGRGLLLCAITGGLAAMAFQFPGVFRENISGPFAVWQAAVGTLLLWLRTARDTPAEKRPSAG